MTTTRNQHSAGVGQRTVADLGLLQLKDRGVNGAILEHVLSLAARSSEFMCKLIFNERGRIDERDERREGPAFCVEADTTNVGGRGQEKTSRPCLDPELSRRRRFHRGDPQPSAAGLSEFPTTATRQRVARR